MSTDPTLQAISSWLPKQPKPLTDREIRLQPRGEDRTLPYPIECLSDDSDEYSYDGPYNRQYRVERSGEPSRLLSDLAVQVAVNGEAYYETVENVDAHYARVTGRNINPDQPGFRGGARPTYVVFDEAVSFDPSSVPDIQSSWVDTEIPMTAPPPSPNLDEVQAFVETQMHLHALANPNPTWDNIDTNISQSIQDAVEQDRRRIAEQQLRWSWVDTPNPIQAPTPTPTPTPTNTETETDWRRIRREAVRHLNYGQREQDAVVRLLAPKVAKARDEILIRNESTDDYVILIPSLLRLPSEGQIYGMKFISSPVREMYVAKRIS